MKINEINRVYFIGAGGIGMSALARYLIHLGKQVAGYDRTPSTITLALSDLGMYIQFADDLKLIPQDFFKKDTLIVYTPAVKRDENYQLDYFLSNDFKVIKRAELLAIITNNTISIAVAGTHGKTSTSSLLGHILKLSDVSATSFLGGVTENYQSNLILGGNQYTVVEADEFDRSFLQLSPDYACITSIDADHLDIYGQAENLENTFKEFASLTKKKLFVRKGIPIQGISFGIEENADYNATNIRIENGVYIFDVQTPTEKIVDLKIKQPGRYNVLNTVAALAMANNIGVSLQDIAKALLSYRGVKRRFSYIINNENLILIDDYAHHPTEIDAVYKSLRELYPNNKILSIFQPHLYSRTRDFESDFIQVLSRFDKIMLLPIYPAREKPILGVSSQNLVDKIKTHNKNVSLVQSDELVSKIKECNYKIVLMIGAGDIGEMIKEVKQKIKKTTR
jgi:UDP-N-acetylmuramate--alanine ligase